MYNSIFKCPNCKVPISIIYARDYAKWGPMGMGNDYESYEFIGKCPKHGDIKEKLPVNEKKLWQDEFKKSILRCTKCEEIGIMTDIKSKKNFKTFKILCPVHGKKDEKTVFDSIFQEFQDSPMNCPSCNRALSIIFASDRLKEGSLVEAMLSSQQDHAWVEFIGKCSEHGEIKTKLRANMKYKWLDDFHKGVLKCTKCQEIGKVTDVKTKKEMRIFKINCPIHGKVGNKQIISSLFNLVQQLEEQGISAKELLRIKDEPKVKPIKKVEKTTIPLETAYLESRFEINCPECQHFFKDFHIPRKVWEGKIDFRQRIVCTECKNEFTLFISKNPDTGRLDVQYT